MKVAVARGDGFVVLLRCWRYLGGFEGGIGFGKFRKVRAEVALMEAVENRGKTLWRALCFFNTFDAELFWRRIFGFSGRSGFPENI